MFNMTPYRREARLTSPGFACVIEGDTAVDGIVTTDKGQPVFTASTLNEAREILAGRLANGVREACTFWAQGINGEYARIASFDRAGREVFRVGIEAGDAR